MCQRYVQSSTWRTGYNNKFGYPLFWNVTGTVHTHMLAWKVDLDVEGTANSVNMHTLGVSHGTHDGFQLQPIPTGVVYIYDV